MYDAFIKWLVPFLCCGAITSICAIAVIKFLVIQIRLGKITLDDVPEKYKEVEKAILISR